MKKQTIKKALYDIGAFKRWHRVRNAQNLTTVMLHRILHSDSPEFATADATYTLDVRLFRHCIDFFKDHYNIVGLPDLAAAISGTRPLPPTSMLITLDDGWRDTLTVAAPIFRDAAVPALCFIATSVLDESGLEWWQETFSRAWREGRLDWQKIASIVSAMGVTSAPSSSLQESSEEGSFTFALSLIGRLSPELRAKVLAAIGVKFPRPLERHMLATSEVHQLIEMGVWIGAHGVTHIPLTMSEDPHAELSQSRDQLERLVTGSSQPAVVSMSFPHGRHTPTLVAAALNTGYRFVFTSVSCLTNTTNPNWNSAGLGRIAISSEDIVDDSGEFSEARCAWHLFNRPIA